LPVVISIVVALFALFVDMIPIILSFDVVKFDLFVPPPPLKIKMSEIILHFLMQISFALVGRFSLPTVFYHIKRGIIFQSKRSTKVGAIVKVK
jgi:hypothetical protein